MSSSTGGEGEALGPSSRARQSSVGNRGRREGQQALRASRRRRRRPGVVGSCPVSSTASSTSESEQWPPPPSAQQPSSGRARAPRRGVQLLASAGAVASRSWREAGGAILALLDRTSWRAPKRGRLDEAGKSARAADVPDRATPLPRSPRIPPARSMAIHAISQIAFPGSSFVRASARAPTASSLALAAAADDDRSAGTIAASGRLVAPCCQSLTAPSSSPARRDRNGQAVETRDRRRPWCPRAGDRRGLI